MQGVVLVMQVQKDSSMLMILPHRVEVVLVLELQVLVELI